MQREPAVDHGGFNCPSIFIGAAASGHELYVDLAYRRTPLVGYDRIRQLKQFPLGCLGRGERAIFLEFHLPFFGRYTLCEDYISHDQSYHRDEGHQRYACVDGEHDHRRTLRFGHARQRGTKATFGQAHIEGYC
jgi:hypothetical protein